MTANEMVYPPQNVQAQMKNVALSLLGSLSAAMLVAFLLFAWIVGIRGLSVLLKSGFGS
jgi:hypothetical protein